MKKIIVLLSTLIVVSFCSCARDMRYGQAIILYTNDVHGQIDGKLTYASVGKMKQDLKNRGNNVLLLDSGDFISGGYYCDYDKGRSFVNAMSMAGYDACTLGNHEFDYKFDYLEELMKSASFPFISSNFYHLENGKPTTRFTPLGHKVFKLKGINIGVFGLSTPDSITTSTPAHFKDDKGNFIYTFLDNAIYQKAQEEIDEMRYECDFIVCMSHLGDENQDVNYTATKLAKNTIGLDLILDGHTHFEVKKKVVKNAVGKDVVITQSGSKLKKIGMATVTRHGVKDTILIPTYPDYVKQIRDLEHLIISELDKRYSVEIATSQVDFVRGNGKREDNIGDLISEAYYYYYNSKDDPNLHCDFAITNTGGIRADVQPGVWKLKTCKLVLSFSNVLCLKKFNRQTIKKALEFSSYKMPDEYFGGQQQVCGLKYKVKKDVKSDIVVDSKGAYVSGPSEGHEKVYDIEVYDKNSGTYKPFEGKEYYNVASIGYVINDCGDGMSMFNGGEIISLEQEAVDFKGLANYINNFTHAEGELPVISAENSPLKTMYPNLNINYTDPGFGGRISII